MPACTLQPSPGLGSAAGGVPSARECVHLYEDGQPGHRRSEVQSGYLKEGGICPARWKAGQRGNGIPGAAGESPAGH